jgi:hypothetical protein
LLDYTGILRKFTDDGDKFIRNRIEAVKSSVWRPSHPL